MAAGDSSSKPHHVELEVDMYHITIATEDTGRFQTLAGHLKSKPDIELEWTQTLETTLDNIESRKPQLVIVDDSLSGVSGIDVVRKIIGVNPMINTAVATDMPDEEFHDASEGLGILAHLPLSPGVEDSEALLSSLKQIMGL